MGIDAHFGEVLKNSVTCPQIFWDNHFRKNSELLMACKTSKTSGSETLYFAENGLSERDIFCKVCGNFDELMMNKASANIGTLTFRNPQRTFCRRKPCCRTRSSHGPCCWIQILLRGLWWKDLRSSSTVHRPRRNHRRRRSHPRCGFSKKTNPSFQALRRHRRRDRGPWRCQ